MVRVSRGLAVGVLLAGLASAGAAEKPAVKSEKTSKRPAVIVAPPPAEIVVEAVRAESDAYARRLDACTRLRQIAIETGNDNLLNETDELERLAAAVYQARVARMGLSRSQAPKPALSDRLPASIDPTKVAPPTPGRATR